MHPTTSKDAATVGHRDHGSAPSRPRRRRRRRAPRSRDVLGPLLHRLRLRRVRNDIIGKLALRVGGAAVPDGVVGSDRRLGFGAATEAARRRACVARARSRRLWYRGAVAEATFLDAIWGRRRPSPTAADDAATRHLRPRPGDDAPPGRELLVSERIGAAPALPGSADDAGDAPCPRCSLASRSCLSRNSVPRHLRPPRGGYAPRRSTSATTRRATATTFCASKPL